MSRITTLTRAWRLLARYLRPEWRHMLLLAAILGLSIGGQVAAPLLAAAFIDRATGDAPLRVLLVLAGVTIALAFARQAAAVVETWLAEQVSWSATNALRLDLVAHLLRLDAAFHDAHTPGELLERVDGDVSTLARFFSRFVVSVAGNLLLIVVVLALLLRVDWRIGLAVSAFVGVALLVMLRIRALAIPAWAASRQASADFYGFLGESLDAREDVRSSGARAFVMRRCAEVMRVWYAAMLRAEMLGYVIVASSQLLFALGTAAAFALAAWLYRDGALTIGAVYLVFQYTTLLRQPTEQIRNELQDLQQAEASVGRVEGLLATQPGLVDGEVAALPAGPLAVELDGVGFRYRGDTPVLRDVSVRVAPGRVLGIVGRTGSGKTTIARLIARFYDPTEGAVRLGGVDLRAVRLAAVRARVGVVSQDVQLFEASVRDNITLFDAEVSDERVAAVLDELGLARWLAGLPDGLATRLGAGGVRLSEGQAQLLACARIFLADPAVIVLDEASSRLDPATERLLHRALERLLAGRTGIIIAHRLSTIELADELLVLEDGRVHEHGPRAALASDPRSRFATLLRVAGEEVPA